MQRDEPPNSKERQIKQIQPSNIYAKEPFISMAPI